MSGTSSTRTTPSPLDTMKSKYGEQIGPLLMSIISGGMAGSPTAGQMAGNLTAQNQFRRTAGQAGISPGDPRMAEGLQDISEQLTMLNPDMLKYALSLYSGTQAPEGDSRTTSAPGVGDVAKTGATIVQLLSLLSA